MGPYRYDHRIDPDVDNAHTRVLRLVGERKQVLDLGCATGYLSQALVEGAGCRVTGIERDAEAAEQARKACSRVIVGDVESLDFARELGDERFDVALGADFLEHLRDPVAVLRAVRGFLAPGGYVVASIPNVAHASVLAELFQGRFPYRPTGLLDETHLRFFTRESVHDCFERAGFVVSHLERVRVEPEQTEFATDPSRIPAEVWQAIRAGDESDTYQFVLTAHPAPEGGRARLTAALDGLRGAAPDVGVAGRPEAAEDEARFWRGRVEGLLEALLGRMRFLEGERDRHTAELEALRAGVAYHETHTRLLRDDIARREAALVEEIAQRDGQLDYHREQARQLEAQLAELRSGAGWKLLERFRHLRLRVIPPRSRRERVYLRLLRGRGRE
jgi:2-polyprenyl-3-methyl-5-hydroxy-6-metoxy-1,4-benzoquinol methylase